MVVAEPRVKRDIVGMSRADANGLAWALANLFGYTGVKVQTFNDKDQNRAALVVGGFGPNGPVMFSNLRTAVDALFD